MGNNYDIIIIGGGIAGMYAALKLRLNNPGLKILIIEKRDQLGGVCGSVGVKGEDYEFSNLPSPEAIKLIQELMEKFGITIETTPVIITTAGLKDEDIKNFLKESEHYDGNKKLTEVLAGLYPDNQELGNKILTNYAYRHCNPNILFSEVLNMLKNNEQPIPKGGMPALIKKMTKVIKECERIEIVFNLECTTISESEGGQLEVQTKNGKGYHAPTVLTSQYPENTTCKHGTPITVIFVKVANEFKLKDPKIQTIFFPQEDMKKWFENLYKGNLSQDDACSTFHLVLNQNGNKLTIIMASPLKWEKNKKEIWGNVKDRLSKEFPGFEKYVLTCKIFFPEELKELGLCPYIPGYSLPKSEFCGVYQIGGLNPSVYLTLKHVDRTIIEILCESKKGLNEKLTNGPPIKLLQAKKDEYEKHMNNIYSIKNSQTLEKNSFLINPMHEGTETNEIDKLPLNINEEENNPGISEFLMVKSSDDALHNKHDEPVKNLMKNLKKINSSISLLNN